MPKLKLIEPVIDNSPKFHDYKGSAIGWWEVKTEGDCEGRSVQNLGVHFGHIAEIALGLEKGPFYSYRFEPVKNRKLLIEYDSWIIRRKECHISLWVETWGVVKTSKGLEDLKRWFDTNDISVTESNYYACFKIQLNGK